MSAWSVKTRRAPSRYSRDARVYGHTTTAMHIVSTPPPAPPPGFVRLANDDKANSTRGTPNNTQTNITRGPPKSIIKVSDAANYFETEKIHFKLWDPPKNQRILIKTQLCKLRAIRTSIADHREIRRTTRTGIYRIGAISHEPVLLVNTPGFQT